LMRGFEDFARGGGAGEGGFERHEKWWKAGTIAVASVLANPHA
jgi:hypothetical protein